MNKIISSALNWRYATKLFNPDKKVSNSDLNALLEATRLAPSSLGLQPWKAFVISNKEVRQKLKAAAWNQPQVSDASHLVIFTTLKRVTETYIDSYLNKVLEIRNQKKEDVEGYKKMLLGGTVGKSSDEMKAWTARQTYIALGFLLETAALMKIDACPMEGFDTAQFDKILGIDASEYTTVVMAAVGYRNDDDKYATVPKVRFCKEELFIQI
ncbi:MAG: NAD(P)H-dependent oxidoreductase [Candidatus Roizmanbacteria bacterium]|nr:NAD(P)H-dependent oxidoreductase [Candidatus Roizmanbacteria bacterium]